MRHNWRAVLRICRLHKRNVVLGNLGCTCAPLGCSCPVCSESNITANSSDLLYSTSITTPCAAQMLHFTTRSDSQRPASHRHRQGSISQPQLLTDHTDLCSASFHSKHKQRTKPIAVTIVLVPRQPHVRLKQTPPFVLHRVPLIHLANSEPRPHGETIPAARPHAAYKTTLSFLLLLLPTLSTSPSTPSRRPPISTALS
jgi:hypothetical protein